MDGKRNSDWKRGCSMSDLNLLFRERIGFPEEEPITFDKLAIVLEKTAKSIPFENMRVIEKSSRDITVENVVEKILDHHEGGLCYELNALLYRFLAENQFHVSLTRGVIYDHGSGNWSPTGNTHVVILLDYNGDLYVVDTGFGANLPLKPVPLSGETVVSENGEFRIKPSGEAYVLEMKRRYKDEEWKTGYAFTIDKTFKDVSVLNEIQSIIAQSPESPFNRQPLITKLIDGGMMVLTATSFKILKDGEMQEEEIDASRFREIAERFFDMK